MLCQLRIILTIDVLGLDLAHVPELADGGDLTVRVRISTDHHVRFVFDF